MRGQGKEGKPGGQGRLSEAASMDGHLALWHHLLAGANQCLGVQSYPCPCLCWAQHGHSETIEVINIPPYSLPLREGVERRVAHALL